MSLFFKKKLTLLYSSEEKQGAGYIFFLLYFYFRVLSRKKNQNRMNSPSFFCRGCRKECSSYINGASCMYFMVLSPCPYLHNPVCRFTRRHSCLSCMWLCDAREDDHGTRVYPREARRLLYAAGIVVMCGQARQRI